MFLLWGAWEAVSESRAAAFVAMTYRTVRDIIAHPDLHWPQLIRGNGQRPVVGDVEANAIIDNDDDNLRYLRRYAGNRIWDLPHTIVPFEEYQQPEGRSLDTIFEINETLTANNEQDVETTSEASRTISSQTPGRNENLNPNVERADGTTSEANHRSSQTPRWNEDLTAYNEEIVDISPTPGSPLEVNHADCLENTQQDDEVQPRREDQVI